jgi:RNA polymerase sigma-70 factor (ECF subfamily)
MEHGGAETMPGEVSDISQVLKEPGLAALSLDNCDSGLQGFIERARQGDAAAFEEIMIRYERRVLRTAWRMLGSREDAQDAAQDVFFRVFKYLRSYRPNQDFEGWLYRIIVNACRDIARKRTPLAATSSDPQAGATDLDSIAAACDLEESAIQSQQRTIIAEALATLSRKEREALVLRDLEGLSTEEVARLLGSSQTTVRSQISSARRKIRLFKDRLMKQRQG